MRFSHPVLLAAALAPLLLLPAACSKNTAAPAATAAGAALPEGTRTLLERYEKLRAALAADNLRDAKFHAGQLAAEANKPETPAPAKALAAPAETLAGSARLDNARDAFKLLSAAAIPLAAGAGGFYVINCPMTPNGDWLQTNDKVANPYFGRTMLECGVVKK